jgi:MFS family permease
MTLETANTWFSLAPRLALVLGPLVAGLLVTTVGAVNTLYRDAAIFFVSAALVLSLVPSVERSARERARLSR